MTTIKEAAEDLFNNPQLSVQEVVDRHYIPAFRQRTNGSWDDRAALVARVDEFRKHVEHATVTVLDELIDGEHYAERHVIDLLQRDGQRLLQEVYVFAQRDPDGRFVRIEETTLALESQ